MEQLKYPDNPVLLVDDEAQLLQSASFSLRTSKINNLIKCQKSEEVLGILQQQSVSVILLDILMPNKTGRELLPEISEKFPHIPVIMLTALNEVEIAVECMKAGAFDYLIKPVDKTRLVTTVKNAVEHSELKGEKDRLKEYLLTDTLKTPEAFENIVTRNKSMRSICKYIEAIAGTALPVLITGDTGAGKEVIARAVHKASGRQGEFVPVNVAGLDDNLFSDTLFGHQKGAYTGADKARVGLIGKAAGGTLFLDEIGDLSMESQVKLLRLLEERTYYPIGSDDPVSTDARVVVATNVDLEAKQNQGAFRKDLFYRLQNHQVHLPSLKDRKDDIPLLTDFFIEEAAKDLDKNVPTPPSELYKLLVTYAFPGNVRELKSMVFDAVSRHMGGILSMDAFKTRIEKSRSCSAAPEDVQIGDGLLLPEELPTLKELESIVIEEALKRAQGNQTIAAQMIGLTRSALNKRLNRPAK